ncbi:hypothetical protein EON63_08935 [archaeon]|nr:MAG: hypothetical protein EON63_08935 [archaeon]
MVIYHTHIKSIQNLTRQPSYTHEHTQFYYSNPTPSPISSIDHTHTHIQYYMSNLLTMGVRRLRISLAMYTVAVIFTVRHPTP